MKQEKEHLAFIDHKRKILPIASCWPYSDVVLLWLSYRHIERSAFDENLKIVWIYVLLTIVIEGTGD